MVNQDALRRLEERNRLLRQQGLDVSPETTKLSAGSTLIKEAIGDPFKQTRESIRSLFLPKGETMYAPFTRTALPFLTKPLARTVLPQIERVVSPIITRIAEEGKLTPFTPTIVRAPAEPGQPGSVEELKKEELEIIKKGKPGSAALRIIDRENRILKQVVSGALSLPEGLTSAARWKGIEEAKSIEDRVSIWRKQLAVENPDFFDALASGYGSAVAFFVPGFGIANLTQTMAVVSPGVALWFGAGTSAALESMAEAGQVYNENINQGMSEQEASDRASKTFWLNAIGVTLTNRFGIFGEQRNQIIRALSSGASEGLQEGFQQIIGNWATNKPWDEGVAEATGVGAIVGTTIGLFIQTPSGEQELNPEIVQQTLTELSRNDSIQGTDTVTKLQNIQVPPIKNATELESFIRSQLTTQEQSILEGNIRGRVDQIAFQEQNAAEFPGMLQSTETPARIAIPPRFRAGLQIEEIPADIEETVARTETPEEFTGALEEQRASIREQINQGDENTELVAAIQRINNFLEGQSTSDIRTFFQNVKQSQSQLPQAPEVTPQRGETAPGQLFIPQEVVKEGPAIQIPEILQPFAKQVANLGITLEEFLNQLQNTLKSQNRNDREVAQNFLRVVEEAGQTPEQFFQATQQQLQQPAQRFVRGAGIRQDREIIPILRQIPPFRGGPIPQRLFGAQLPARGIFKRVSERAPKVVREEQLLKERIRAEARGARFGVAQGKRITREELMTQFRSSRRNAQQVRDTLREFIKNEIPLEEQGRFLTALSREISKKDQYRLYQRIIDTQDRIERKGLVEELQNVPKGGIAVDYQKKLDEVMRKVDFQNPTENTLRELIGLYDFIKREGIPLGINKEHLVRLERLNKRSVRSITTQELRELRDTVNTLRELGKLKLKLKNKYNERERQRNLAKLLESTRNLDPTAPKRSGELTQFDKWNIGTRKAYMATMHTPRVADSIDGFKGYQGQNAQLIKKHFNAEIAAKVETQRIVSSALEEVQNIGVKELTSDQQFRIMTNIRLQEGAHDQVKTLLISKNLPEVPKLTEQEQQIVNILKKYTTSKTDEIAAVYEEINNEIFPRLQNYILPIKYEDEFNLVPSDSITQNRHRTTQTFQGFVYARQPGVKKMPRVDIFGVFEEAINEQQWYLQLQPVLENTKYLVRTKEYNNKAGDLATDFWKSYLDVVSRRGWSATAKSSPILRQARINLNQAVLGYRFSSIAMQPFALVDALSYTTSRFGATAALDIASEFTKAWIIPKYAEAIIKESKTLQVRKGGEIAVEETLQALKQPTSGRLASAIPEKVKKPLKRFQRGGLSFLKAADLQTAAGVRQGILRILKRNNVPYAEEEADFLMNMVSGSAEVTLRPLILSEGEGSRTLFTFQTFFLNRWGIIAHDLVRSGVLAGDWKRKFGAILGLAILAAGRIAEEETRRFILKVSTGKEFDRLPSWLLAMLMIPEQVPLFGNMIYSFINYGNAGFDFPLARTVENTIGGLGVITREKEEAKLRAGVKGVEAATSLFIGLPGTSQIFDVIERLLLTEKKKGRISI